MNKTAATRARKELRNAHAANESATQEALQKGLVATQPLTAARLGELCELGEKMMRTGIRQRAAMARVSLFRDAA